MTFQNGEIMATARFGGLAISIAGFVSMISALIYLNTPPSSPFVTQAEITMTATFDSILALIIIIGGITGLLRRAFKLTIAGGCIGLFEGMLFSMSGLSIVILLLSIVGIALVAMGRDEFGTGRKKKGGRSSHPTVQPKSKPREIDERENYSDVLNEYMKKR
jgi:hypothetical protein